MAVVDASGAPVDLHRRQPRFPRNRTRGNCKIEGVTRRPDDYLRFPGSGRIGVLKAGLRNSLRRGSIDRAGQCMAAGVGLLSRARHPPLLGRYPQEYLRCQMRFLIAQCQQTGSPDLLLGAGPETSRYTAVGCVTRLSASHVSGAGLRPVVRAATVFSENRPPRRSTSSVSATSNARTDS